MRAVSLMKRAGKRSGKLRRSSDGSPTGSMDAEDHGEQAES